MPRSSLTPARRLAAAAARAVIGAALVIGPAAVGAQSVTIIGYVTDTATSPIPAAEVVVDGTRLAARTDDKGAFRLTGIAPGRLTITTRRLGFRGRSDRYEGAAGDTLQLLLDLVAMPTELAEVTVRGKKVPRRSTGLDEFESRRARGFGAFITRADIERRNPIRTSDLLRTVTGVAIIRSGMYSDLRMARSQDCAPDIYIDGQEARGYRIDDMPPVDIAGIEVFRGPAEVPVRFKRLWSGCGVVSIWTRLPGS